MSAYEAWIVDKRPIYSRLPDFLKTEVADWVTYFWDEELCNLLAKLKDFGRQINPETCDPEWLDFLAPLFGFDNPYWDQDWGIESKRALLKNAYSGIDIWARKGNSEVLSFVLSALLIKNEVVQNGSFIVGEDEVGDRLGIIAWDYTIYLPPQYQGTDKEKLALKINKLFGACYCNSRIVYDPGRFVEIDLMIDSRGNIITTEAAEALRVDGRIYANLDNQTFAPEQLHVDTFTRSGNTTLDNHKAEHTRTSGYGGSPENFEIDSNHLRSKVNQTSFALPVNQQNVRIAVDINNKTTGSYISIGLRFRSDNFSRLDIRIQHDYISVAIFTATKNFNNVAFQNITHSLNTWIPYVLEVNGNNLKIYQGETKVVDVTNAADISDPNLGDSVQFYFEQANNGLINNLEIRSLNV